jgi:serine/threonine protein kinase
MWSIGSITSTVLGGEIIFAAYQFRGASEKRYYQGVLELASQCDLSVLDDASNLVWTKVGDRPKDFIKKLLVLREDDRMTADEALAHDWFSNKFHAAEFEALYERTTRDWKPRPKASIFVEPILRDVTADSLPDSALSREPASHFFASPPGDSGDHTSFGNTSTSPTRQTNIPLSSIVEGDEPEYVYTRSCMDQEPTNPMHEGMYEADGDFGGRDDASANVEDAQYDFSIPAPPPLTPTAEEDSVIVLETPMRATKQFHEQPDDAEAAAASATAATYGHGSIKSFAQRLSKEKKHRYRPY